MRTVSVLLALSTVLCLVSMSAPAQQATSSSETSGSETSQSASIIQQSLTALTGGSAVTDVTMTGAYTVTNASGTQSGTIRMVATASGQGESTVTLPSGTYSEIRSIAAGSASMIETGPDGIPHAISTQTAVSPNPAWFCPALVLAAASSPNYSSSYIGQEMLNGETVQHLAVWWLPGNSSSSSSGTLTQFWQQVTRHDIYLDASSRLPVSMTFPLHPYDPQSPTKPLIPYRGSNADRTIQLLFFDYQVVEGRLVALHIRSTMKTSVGTVTSDIHISSVTFNTGATVSMPSSAN